MARVSSREDSLLDSPMISIDEITEMEERIFHQSVSHVWRTGIVLVRLGAELRVLLHVFELEVV
jgi:hypothetical protein